MYVREGAYSASGGQKRALDPLTGVTDVCEPGGGARVLCKHNQYS